MLRNPFLKFFYDQRVSLLVWNIALVATSVMYVGFYPMMKDQQMASAINSYPEAVRDALGLQDLASPAGYLSGTVFGLVVPTLVIIFAVLLGLKVNAADEEAGTLDLLMSYPISRTSFYVQRAAAVLCCLLDACALIFIAVLLTSRVVDMQIEVDRLAAACLLLVALAAVFAILAVAVSGVMGRRAVAGGVAGAIAVVAYLANSFAPQIPDIEGLRKISAFYYYSAGDPLSKGLDLGHLGILTAAVILLLVAGSYAFSRRDIASV